MEMEKQAALEGIRTLDLTNHMGVLCGKLLADMGADVIKIEKPGGDAMRSIGPFYRDIPHPERSLYWWHYNTSKRGITLDIENEDSRRLFTELIKTADILIESHPAGYLEGIGYGWPVLQKINPHLILTSITPYGQTGPYRDYPASDTVIQAMSGMMSTLGKPDGPPVHWWGPQAMHSSSYYGAIGTLCALIARDTTGRGQQVDISMEEAACSATENVNFMALYLGMIYKRWGPLHWTGGFKNTATKDGWVVLNSMFGDWTSLVGWLESDGMAGDLTDPQWAEPLNRRFGADHIFEILDKWAAGFTRDELVEESQLRRLPTGPLNTPEEIVKLEHLTDRGYFHDIEHPELGIRIRYPGAPYLFHGTPWRIRRRAPLIGEDNVDVYEKELGCTKEELAVLAGSGII